MAKKILYFEDEQYIAEMYRLLLEQKGYSCAHYNHPPADAKKLVNLVLSARPDLIIMDVLMPIMDGYKATKIIKADTRIKLIPILGLCNLWQPEEIKKAIGLGMIDYLGKTQYQPSEVVGIIAECLKKQDKYEPRYKEFI